MNSYLLAAYVATGVIHIAYFVSLIARTRSQERGANELRRKG